MKFRNKETGEEFPYIQAARVSFCLYRENAAMMACYTCKLSSRNNGEHSGCVEFCEEHPHEAARLMGYEVVEDEPNIAMANEIQRISDAAKESAKIIQDYLNKEEANMDKPLVDQKAKADAGKLRPTLVPVSLIEAVTAIRMYGNQKYGDPENWRQVEPQRYRDALYRHWLAYLKGEKCDQESGLPHLWHLACNAAFLIEMEETDGR